VSGLRAVGTIGGMMRINILAAALMGVMVGCSAARSPVVEDAAPTKLPATVPVGPLEVRYGTHLNPAKLSPQQLAEITEIAEAHRPAGREIWYVRVATNDKYKGEWHYSAAVYYTPDVTTGRIRKGKMTGASSMFGGVAEHKKLRERLRESAKRHPEELSDTDLGEWVQIAPADRPFGTELKVLFGAVAPFAPVKGISDDDLVAIVDDARRAHDVGRLAEVDEPICMIEIDGEEKDKFVVFFGWLDAPLAGGGSVVTVRKTPKGYKAPDGAGHWVS